MSLPNTSAYIAKRNAAADRRIKQAHWLSSQTTEETDRKAAQGAAVKHKALQERSDFLRIDRACRVAAVKEKRLELERERHAVAEGLAFHSAASKGNITIGGPRRGPSADPDDEDDPSRSGRRIHDEQQRLKGLDMHTAFKQAGACGKVLHHPDHLPRTSQPYMPHIDGQSPHRADSHGPGNYAPAPASQPQALPPVLSFIARRTLEVLDAPRGPRRLMSTDPEGANPSSPLPPPSRPPAL